MARTIIPFPIYGHNIEISCDKTNLLNEFFNEQEHPFDKYGVYDIISDELAQNTLNGEFMVDGELVTWRVIYHKGSEITFDLMEKMSAVLTHHYSIFHADMLECAILDHNLSLDDFKKAFEEFCKGRNGEHENEDEYAPNIFAKYV